MTDLTLYLAAALAGLLTAGITFAICHRLHGKQLRELNARLAKLEASRQTALQHAQQARRQVEQMQKDMAAQQQRTQPDAGARQRVQAMEQVLRDADRRIVEAPPALPAHGFAETLPMAAMTEHGGYR